MKTNKAYSYSFKLGLAIQLLLLPFMFYHLADGLILSFVNMIASLFIYPMIAIWIEKQDHFHIPPELGPHQ